MVDTALISKEALLIKLNQIYKNIALVAIITPHDAFSYECAECEPDTGGVTQPLVIHHAGVYLVEDQRVDKDTKRKNQDHPYHKTPHLEPLSRSDGKYKTYLH